jgi:glucosamine-6-phosphate deaminase
MSFSPVGLISTFQADRLQAGVYHSATAAAGAAATTAAEEIRRLVDVHKRAIGLFSASPSQNLFLDALAGDEDVVWTRVIALQLEETLGVAEASLQRQLLDHLIKKVPIAEFHGLRGDALNPQAVCINYAETLRSRPPDFASLDLGSDGRLAANAPAVCDFEDPADVKIVEVDDLRALTLTLPAIISCPMLIVLATGEEKSTAVKDTLSREPSPTIPSSILRSHPDCRLFLDLDAASSIKR